MYKSNWLVANCRYDALLRMLFHIAHNLDIDYAEKTMKTDSVETKLETHNNDLGIQGENLAKAYLDNSLVDCPIDQCSLFSKYWQYID